MRKRLTSVVLVFAMLAALVTSGCSFGGRTVLSCKPDNLIGLREVKIGGGRVTMLFDKEQATRTDKTPFGALNEFFKNGNADGFHAVLFVDGKEQYETKFENITVDPENCTISFEFKGVRTSKITGFRITSSSKKFPFGKPDTNFEYCLIDLRESKLSVCTYVEESSGWDRPLSGYYARLSTITSQTYDKEKETWSDLEFKNERAEMWS